MVRSKVTGGKRWGATILAGDMPEGISKAEFLSIARNPNKTEKEKDIMRQAMANAMARMQYEKEEYGEIRGVMQAKTSTLKKHKAKGLQRLADLEKRMRDGEPLTDFQKGQVDAYRKDKWRKLKKRTHGENASVPVSLKKGQKLTKGISRKTLDKLQEKYDIAREREEERQNIKLLKSSPRKAAAALSLYGSSPYEDYVSIRVRKQPPTKKEIVSATARYMGVNPQDFGGVSSAWIERRKQSKQWGEIEKDIYNRREKAYLGTNASYRHWAKREAEIRELDNKRLYGGSQEFGRREAQKYNELAKELGKPYQLKVNSFSD